MLVVSLYVGAALLLVSHCAPKGTCLRFSDCDQGLTCSDGLCVAVAPSADAGDTSDSGVTGEDAESAGEDSSAVSAGDDARAAGDAEPSAPDAAFADAIADAADAVGKADAGADGSADADAGD
jgi:hypothetical protein